MSNVPPLGVLGQPGRITPTNPPTKKVYSFVCWRCGSSRRLIVYHTAGGLLRICALCAEKVGLL